MNFLDSTYILLQIIFAVSFSNGAQISSQCNNGWVTFEGSENCYKVYNNEYVNKNEAKIICQREGINEDESQLVKITSNLEQNFLSKYLFDDLNIMDGVWIGVVRNNKNYNNAPADFIYDDGTNVLYNNWAESFPTNNNGRQCVRMLSKLSSGVSTNITNGQWADTSCDVKNIVICQKLQIWSVRDVQIQLLQFKNKMIPIGFLYTQLQLELPPQNIWPWMGWSIVKNETTTLVWKRVS